MDISNIKKMKDKNPVVLFPIHDKNLKDTLSFTFNNALAVENVNDKDIIEEFLNCINDGKTKDVIFVNYIDFYRKIIADINTKKNIKWLITHSVASFTNGSISTIFRTIMEFYDRDIVKTIMCTDRGLYELLKKKKYNCEFVSLGIDNRNIKNSYSKDGTIGIISNDYDPMHNFYNQLTAIKITNYKKVKLISTMPSTSHFLDFFGINYTLCDSVFDVMKNNSVNLYCNFTNADNYLVLKSMDMGIPCIMGNSDLFDNYDVLKKYLVLNSDDDVNEIAEKINNVSSHYDLIFKEYVKFRKNYLKESKGNISDY